MESTAKQTPQFQSAEAAFKRICDQVEAMQNSKIWSADPQIGEQFRALAKDLQEIETLNEEMYSEMISVNNKNAELDQFAHILSHDLRAPLRHISNLTRILQNDPISSASTVVAAGLEKILSASDNAASILNNMRELTKAQSGKVEKSEFDLNALIEDIVETHHVDLEQKNTRVEISFLPSVVAVKSLVWQVFDNLIRNALLHGLQNHEISIAADMDKTPTVFSVRNSVHQIPADMTSLFDPLKSASGNGTGLGLFICKKIIEFHHGHIWAKVDNGNFVVSFTLEENIDGGN